MEYNSLFPRRHNYSLVSSGLKKTYNKNFYSRNDANEYMYKLFRKYHLHIIEVYDDKHNKTYKCENDVKFFIQRVY